MSKENDKINFLLSDEEICKLSCGCYLNDCDVENKRTCTSFIEVLIHIQAELDHLAELGVVYVKEAKTCIKCDGTGEIESYDRDKDDVINIFCPNCDGYGFLQYIPLSEYMEAKE